MSAEAYALALEIHRAPLQYRQLTDPRRPLPKGVGSLLEAATARDEDLAARIAEAGLSDVSPAQLRQAAAFFVRYVLLGTNVDHYRTLGLTPGAPLDQIKQHHRLLMRMFHPDREAGPEEWQDAYASRLNQAYNVLRNVEQRAAYDQELLRRSHRIIAAESAKREAASPSFRATTERVYTGPRLRTGRLTRHAPSIVVGASALAAVIVVVSTYLGRQPVVDVSQGDAGPRDQQTLTARAEAPELPRAAAALPTAALPLESPAGRRSASGTELKMADQAAGAERSPAPATPAPSGGPAVGEAPELPRAATALPAALPLESPAGWRSAAGAQLKMADQAAGAERSPAPATPAPSGGPAVGEAPAVEASAVSVEAPAAAGPPDATQVLEAASQEPASLAAAEEGPADHLPSGHAGSEHQTEVAAIDTPSLLASSGSSEKAPGVARSSKSPATAPSSKVRIHGRVPAGTASDKRLPAGREAGAAAVVASHRPASAPEPPRSAPVVAAQAPAARDRGPSVATNKPAVVPHTHIPAAATRTSPRAGVTETSTTPQPTGIKLADLKDLERVFIDAYEAGDLRRFIALFARDARADDIAGRDKIAHEYASTFGSTVSRRMALANIHWFSGQQAAWGEGQYVLKVRKSLFGQWLQQHGRITFHVAPGGRHPVITALFHTTETP